MKNKRPQCPFYRRPFLGKQYKRINSFRYRVTLDGEFEKDDPITIKLAMYTMAHRNYLYSISDYDGIAKAKINWGLKRIRKIEE